MLKSSHCSSAIAALLIVASAAATAQTKQPFSAAAAASTPSTSVGVSPQVAASASQKAVPRSDTATLVRTGPAAPDKARQMGNAASGAVSSAMASSQPGRPAKSERK